MLWILSALAVLVLGIALIFRRPPRCRDCGAKLRHLRDGSRTCPKCTLPAELL